MRIGKRSIQIIKYEGIDVCFTCRCLGHAKKDYHTTVTPEIDRARKEKVILKDEDDTHFDELGLWNTVTSKRGTHQQISSRTQNPNVTSKSQSQAQYVDLDDMFGPNRWSPDCYRSVEAQSNSGQKPATVNKCIFFGPTRKGQLYRYP